MSMESLIEDPPRGAWVEEVRSKGKTYYYLRWKEGNRKRSVRLTREQAERVRQILEKRRGLGNPKPDNSGDNSPSPPPLPTFEELEKFTRELAEKGDEDAQKLLKRMRRDKPTILRVLKMLEFLRDGKL